MDQTENDAVKRREHVRTNDDIPIYYESADGASADPTPWEMMFDDIEPGPEENPRLYELLFDINQKLNILINQMSEKTGFNMPEAKEANISGGGMRFYCQDKFEVGERLVIKTFLPVHAHVIKLNSEVVRVEPRDGGGYEVAVKYLDLDEATRDKIIRYIFAKQRKDLRKTKGKEE